MIAKRNYVFNTYINSRQISQTFVFDENNSIYLGHLKGLTVKYNNMQYSSEKRSAVTQAWG